MFVPEYYPKIVEAIRAADWLVHNFTAEDVDIYNAVDYQHHRQFEGIKYQVILDMNFLQYLLNLVKRQESNDLSRTAAAYLTFFQIADIQLDPTYAIYEKINYTDDRADEAIFNLEQFRGINNHSLDELAAYALGYKKRLEIVPVVSSNRDELKNSLLKYRRLTDWDSLYLCVLSITFIAVDNSIAWPNKLVSFVRWCITEFRFSLAALVYAAALFGRAPAKKMMKYKAKDTILSKSAALRNMTWDLYYIDRYMKSWVGKDNHTENFMLTADSGLKLTMQLAVKCQIADGLEPLRPHLAKEFDKIEEVYATRLSVPRAFKSEEWNHEYREKLVSKYESQLIKPET